jgi:hypothetical protein
LARQLAHVRAVLDVDFLARHALALGGTDPLARRPSAQLVDGARDRLLGDLAVDGLGGMVGEQGGRRSRADRLDARRRSVAAELA